MQHIVILGAGSGGTPVANRMVRRLPRDWSVTVVDPEVLAMQGLKPLPTVAGRDGGRRWRMPVRVAASSRRAPSAHQPVACDGS